VAVASAVTVLVLLAWSVGALASTGDGTTTRLANRAAVSAPQQASPSPAAPVAPAPQPGTEGPTAPEARPPVDTPTDAAPQAEPPTPAAGPESTSPTASPPASRSGSTTAATSEPAATATARATNESLQPDDTPRASSPVPPPAPVPPSGPVPCTNDMLGVTAEIDRPEHRVGERPLLRLVVTNTSDQPCVRDLDPVRMEIVVWSADGAERLWSSNDCSNAAGMDLRTLVPGQPVASSVRWAGRTSAPGCPVERSTVPAGQYRVMSRVDDVISAPTPFLRNP
jgi:hypothetical protein